MQILQGCLPNLEKVTGTITVNALEEPTNRANRNPYTVETDGSYCDVGQDSAEEEIFKLAGGLAAAGSAAQIHECWGVCQVGDPPGLRGVGV